MVTPFAIWACFFAIAASGLFRLKMVRRLRAELSASQGESPAENTAAKANLIELLREHRFRFPASRTRTLSNVAVGIQALAAATAMAVIIAAQFQPHSLFHLIAGR